MQLKIAEAVSRDIGRGIARIDLENIEKIGEIGSIVKLSGKRETMTKLMPTHQQMRGQGLVQVDGIIRHNLGLGLGETVEISKTTVQPAKELLLVPLEKTTVGLKGQHIAKALLNLPVVKGDQIRVPLIGGRELDFVVKETMPQGDIMIKEATRIKLERAPGEKGPQATGKSYEDIGGLKEEIQRVREMIELPLRYPQVFERLGIEPPKGVLLIGPPGCGKTLLARAVAHEVDAHFYSISGSEIFVKWVGESAGRLRQLFQEAEANPPAVIFIDEIDALAPKREKLEVGGAADEQHKNVVTQFCTLLDGLKQRGEIVVIGATNQPNILDPAIRRPGRFDREIYIGLPNREARLEILEIHSRAMPLTADVELEELANITHGFSGADLASLCREAAMICLRDVMPNIDVELGIIPQEEIAKLEVQMSHFQMALAHIEPSALREVLIETPTETWQDVGGLEDVKKELQKAIEWPLKYPKLFQKAHTKPAKGIMLSGPPGCGKTLLARAVARESEMNFISVKGPSLLSMFVGESERGVREVFHKARLSAPCIIFLDEIDALAPVRGQGDSSGVSSRVVSQLLVELDGIEELRGIVVMAATNRLDILDPALLRPGRFNKALELPLPDEQARLEIFKIHTRQKPLAKDVNLENLTLESEGLTGADIAGMCEEAALLAMEEYIEAGENPENPENFEIKAEQFEKVIHGWGWKSAIEQEFKNCLQLFPELQNQGIEIIIEESSPDELKGGKATTPDNRPVVIVLVPKSLQNKPKAIRPIIIHELCHFLNLENPDKIFMERADEDSKRLWRILQQEGIVECIVGG